MAKNDAETKSENKKTKTQHSKLVREAELSIWKERKWKHIEVDENAENDLEAEKNTSKTEKTKLQDSSIIDSELHEEVELIIRKQTKLEQNEKDKNAENDIGDEKNITTGTCVSLQSEYIPTSYGEENGNTFIPSSQSKPFRGQEVGRNESVVKTAHFADRKECIQNTARIDGVLMAGTLQGTKVFQEMLKNKPNSLLEIDNNEMIHSTKIARGNVT